MPALKNTPYSLPAHLRDNALFYPSPNDSFKNPSFGDASVRVLILRLSPWRDVASSSPHLFLAESTRRAIENVYLDFAFLPLSDDRKLLRASQLPMVLGIQSRRGITDFDLILVSNSFTLETINLPVILMDAGLSPWAQDRPEQTPPVILGGSNAFASHLLVRADAHAVPDAIFFGEAEDALVPILQAWHAKPELAKRARLLHAAEAADGLWVTGSFPRKPIRQAVARKPSEKRDFYPLLNGETADIVRLPATLGCPAFCSFCFEGYERKPFREATLAHLISQASALKTVSGARTIELDSCSLAHHSEFPSLLLACARLFERVAFKSQRADTLNAQPDLIRLELAAGKRSFTLGIEGITTRLRAFLNKSLDDAAIDQVLLNLLALQVREIKIFYLITGYETAADIASFGQFVDTLATSKTGPRRTTRVIFSFGYLVRMPNTPLRYDALFLDRTQMEYIADNLKRICTRSGFDFRLSSTWTEYAVNQLLAAGGHHLAPIIVSLAADGWVYDGEMPPTYLQLLQTAMEQAGFNMEDLSAPKTKDHVFPFPFVSTTVSANFLHRQYLAAKRNRDTGYCLAGTCKKCGACLDVHERRNLTAHPIKVNLPVDAIDQVDDMTRMKQRITPCFVKVRLGESFSHATFEWISAQLLRLLLAAMPGEEENLLSAEEALFLSLRLRDHFPVPTGETIIAVKPWDHARFLQQLKKVSGLCTGDLTILEPVTPFTPGEFVSALWQVECAGAKHDIDATVAEWLKSTHLLFSLQKDENTTRFNLAPASLKKREVLDVVCRQENDNVVCDLTVTPKTDISALIRLLPTTFDAPIKMRCSRLAL